MKRSKQNQKSKSASPLKQKLILVLKLSFVGGLLYFLMKKGFISIQATQEALKQWHIILPAVGALFLTAFLGVIRWQWLLQAQNIQISWARIFQLTLIGNFFNIALPGAVSGDFVKAFYIGQEIKGQRGRAFGSILFDRLAGVSALVLVSATALIFGFQEYIHSPLFGAIQLLVGIAATSVIVFYSYLFLVGEKHDPLLKVFKTLEKKYKKAAPLTNIYEGIRHYHHCRIAVLKVLLISMIIHATVGWACLSFAHAFGENQISLLAICIVVPLGLLVTAVPVAPAGVGTGNIAFLYFFQLIGSERGADVYSLVAFTNIMVGMLGGLVYFRFRGNEALPNSDTLAIQA
jgi:uncharacterized protein (TIRG00374 family)